jgi:glutathione S-transferase
LSVFRNFDEFRKINPVVKAPTLVCGDGTVLMDSTLILDYVESTLPAERRLRPRSSTRGGGPARHRLRPRCGGQVRVDRLRKEQRPKEKLHEPWFERVVGQANTAFVELEAMMAGARPWLQGDHLTAADVMTAIAWRSASTTTRRRFRREVSRACGLFAARRSAAGISFHPLD